MRNFLVASLRISGFYLHEHLFGLTSLSSETFCTTNPLYQRNFYTWNSLEKCPSKETWNVLPPKCAHEKHQRQPSDSSYWWRGVLSMHQQPAGVVQVDISFSRETPTKCIKPGTRYHPQLVIAGQRITEDFSGLNLEWPSRVKVDALLISLALAGREDKNWWVGQISKG